MGLVKVGVVGKVRVVRARERGFTVARGHGIGVLTG